MLSAAVGQTFKRTLARLDELADAEWGAGASGFFKEPVKARGVRSPQLIELSAEIYREIKPWPVARRDELVTELWKDGYIETGGLACYIYRRFAKTFGEREFRLFERWLDRYAKNLGSSFRVQFRKTAKEQSTLRSAGLPRRKTLGKFRRTTNEAALPDVSNEANAIRLIIFVLWLRRLRRVFNLF